MQCSLPAFRPAPRISTGAYLIGCTFRSRALETYREPGKKESETANFRIHMDNTPR